MTEARLSKNKIEHKSGPTLFRFRANNLEATGHVVPYLGTIAKTTTSEDRKKLVEEEIEKIKNVSDGTLESVGPLIRCPIEKEISIIEQIVGLLVGTVVRGMGSLAVRPARMRGPAKGFFKPVSSVDEEDLRRQLAKRDEEICLLKEGQNEAKKEAAKQRKMIQSLMTMLGANDSNSKGPFTNRVLG